MRWLLLSPLTAILAVAIAQNDTHQPLGKAVDPTSTGQIGVNPVSTFIMTTTYAPEVTNPTVTMTVQSRPTIMHIPWGIARQPNGDVAFPVTPAGKEYLQGIFDDVNAACAKPAKGRKRQSGGPCAPADALRELEKMGSGGGRLDFDFPFDITIPSVTAGDVAIVLQSTPAAVAVAFLAYLMADNGKVDDKEAVKVQASYIHTSQTATTTSEEVPTTTWFDKHDSVETEGSDAYVSLAQEILAQIKSDWSSDNDFWGDTPTPAPLPHPSCGPDFVEMETTIFEKLGASFCNNIDLSKETKKEMTNKDADTDSFADFKFHLNWEPTDKKCSSVKCEDIFSSFASSCSYIGHSMKSLGSMDLDCGKASYDIVPAVKVSDPPKHEDTLVCSSDKKTFLVTGSGADDSITFDVSHGEDAIEAFCQSTHEIDPNLQDTTHSFAQGSTGNGAYYSEYTLLVFWRIALQIGWAQDQEGCDWKSAFRLADIPDCQSILKTAMHGCDTSTTDYKHGGTVSRNLPKVGCVNFDFGAIYTYSLRDSDYI